MTVWELSACVDGVLLSRGIEPEPPPLSAAEFDDMEERHRRIAALPAPDRLQ